MDDELNQNDDPTSTSDPEPTPDSESVVETILSDVKRMLGIQPEVDEFNIDVTSHVNGAFFALYQLGIGPSIPFVIDATTEWSSFETIVPKNVVLDYLYLKTKLVFDPPAASNVFEAYKDRIAELEFRMSIMVDNGGGVVIGQQ